MPCELVVLAGGLGTRLSSVVSDVPKPLAPIAGRPYLHYLIDSWVRQGVRRMTFLLHHRGELIEAFLDRKKEDALLRDCEIRTLTEPQPLGTGGALAYSVRELGMQESFLVANADTWIGSGIGAVQAVGCPCIGVVQVANAERYGTVRIQGNRISAFVEKQGSAGMGWINAGLYHLHPKWFQDWNGQPYSLERELFPKLAESGELKAEAVGGEFIDIGVPEDYFRFCKWIESGKSVDL